MSLPPAEPNALPETGALPGQEARAEAAGEGRTAWRDLRRFTAARVALGRVGNAVPTTAHLDFQAAHARARDAVHSALDAGALAEALARVVRPLGLPVLSVRSEAPDRRHYLMRPDLGRRLLAEDRPLLAAHRASGSLVFVISDGLCASGVQQHAPRFLAEALPLLQRAGMPMAPVVVATQARVALGDAVGEALGARMVAVLIGERPGLSATDSLGLYLTLDPRIGRHDAERNCISNIRPGGMGFGEAAEKLLWLVGAALRLGATGVALKDEQPALPPLAEAGGALSQEPRQGEHT